MVPAYFFYHTRKFSDCFSLLEYETADAFLKHENRIFSPLFSFLRMWKNFKRDLPRKKTMKISGHSSRNFGLCRFSSAFSSIEKVMLISPKIRQKLFQKYKLHFKNDTRIFTSDETSNISKLYYKIFLSRKRNLIKILRARWIWTSHLRCI